MKLIMNFIKQILLQMIFKDYSKYSVSYCQMESNFKIRA